MSKSIIRFLPLLLGLLLAGGARAADSAAGDLTSPDRMLSDYFKTETAKISAAPGLSNISTFAEWQARRPELRREAAEMLGLDPMPLRTPLDAIVTGKLERDDFTVEKVCFQSEPHLYVTANLYLPKPLLKPVPAILYLCGHTSVVTNGVSYGNKTAYQHHGIWFARNGYVCLVMDTLQWGEILGHHHGTFREGMWWWNSRGYTPAGVETWNAIRALDYLESRPEVDRERIGLTGRSGGGAYSWFVAALDDRVKVIVPVAGITDLKNYVVDEAVDGHCDCMFLVNTYRWDYPLLAALCAPRPLLLANSDADSLFPLDGVMRTHDALKHIYNLYGATNALGLTISPGPHKDTQDLQVPAFRWLNVHLRHDDPVITNAAVKMFSPRELKVLEKIPADQINTTIQDSFVAKAPTAQIPATAQAWKQLEETWMKGLREKCFAGWPSDSEPPTMRRIVSEISDGIRYEAYEFQSQSNVLLRVYVMRKSDSSAPHRIRLRVVDESFNRTQSNSSRDETMRAFGTPETRAQLVREIQSDNVARAIFFPRGIGPNAWSSGGKRQAELRRKFMVIGQTLDGMRVWDIRRAVQALHARDDFRESALEGEANGDMAVNTLYASLFEPEIRLLQLDRVPSSHRQGPDYLNVLKILDIPEVAAMAAEHCEVHIRPLDLNQWEFALAIESSRVAILNLHIENEP